MIQRSASATWTPLVTIGTDSSANLGGASGRFSSKSPTALRMRIRTDELKRAKAEN